MSRSGYTEDFGYDEPGRMNLYRGNVARAIQGKRGQAMLRELAVAMDAMPVRGLVARSFKGKDGKVCPLGCLLVARGVDVGPLDAAVGDDDEYADSVAQEAADAVGVARSMAAEVMFENDDPFGFRGPETDEERWARMRRWVDSQIRGEA